MHILLVEPNYKNKYPPLGLMKISTYHKNRGDYVFFYKGKLDSSRMWDRVYITTLFTFDYKKCIDTIKFYKAYVKSLDDIYVGGIMASILANDLKMDTGIKNIVVGRITNSEIIGFNDNINVDELPLDYDILDDTQYKYPAGDNYFGYTSRGCVNKCSFCAVPFLEGKLDITNNIKTQISIIKNKYGDKRNLLLLDNNILGLKDNQLEEIVNDLNELGFVKEASYIKPLRIDVLEKAYYRHIEEGRSPINIMTELSSLLNELKEKKLSKKNKKIMDNMLSKIGTEYEDEIQCILDNIDEIRKVEKAYSYKKLVHRYVDFNQGMDARELTENKMRILSRLPIRPFRIAYDDISFTDIYVNALKLANRYGVHEFSNYILYNYNDKPVDLYKRLEKNIELSEEFGKHIYSFPMRYESINEKGRTYIGVYWNKHYLQSVKAILNVSKGVFGGDRSFFEKAFGESIDEYIQILSMPKDIITYRVYFEKVGVTNCWKNLYLKLSSEEKDKLIMLVSDGIYISENPKINNIMPYYQINYKRILKDGVKQLKLSNGEVFNLVV